MSYVAPYKYELDALQKHLHERAKELVEANRLNNRRDPEIFRHLENAQQLRTQSRHLDAVLQETEAHRRAVDIVLGSVL